MKSLFPKINFFALGIILLSVYACKQLPPFEVNAFDPLSNYPKDAYDTLVMKVSAHDNIFDGLIIPMKDDFQLNFQIRNNGEKDQKYFYKIYYRNESYKYQENIGEGDTMIYNTLAAENFYGSWVGASDGFHETEAIPANSEFVTIQDNFQIVGNPRDEASCFGKDAATRYRDLKKVPQVIASIRSSKEWYDAIVAKATYNRRSVEDQLYLDALWVVTNEANKGDNNNRWKRNPRAGKYSFVLVVAPEDQIDKIPQTIKNLGLKQGDSLFIDPYYNLFHDKSLAEQNIIIQQSPRKLDVHIGFDLSKGIYVNPLKYANPKMDSTSYSDECSQSRELFQSAQIEQFFHNVDKSFVLKTVPEIRNLDEFTVEDYNALNEKYSANDLVKDYIHVTESPCKTAAYDEVEKAIILKNPASTSENRAKENVGVQSRVGFTYGKITAKIKFPSLLNKYGVWNGITNAFWLIYHEDGEWNLRRPCDSLGYIPKGEIGKTDKRIRQTTYTEIDIEIVKASKHWPESSYYNDIPFPFEDKDSPGDITVTSTNWDLACNDPERFSVGVFKVDHNGKSFYPHRWDHWYKALTMKYAANNDSLFHSDFYYYQIDWQPDRIIWRLGPDKDHMTEFGYLDTSVSSIPNNQMTFIVTQEYHHSDWWPTAPYKQDYIPYPANEIVGKVYEIEIE